VLERERKKGEGRELKISIKEGARESYKEVKKVESQTAKNE